VLVAVAIESGLALVLKPTIEQISEPLAGYRALVSFLWAWCHTTKYGGMAAGQAAETAPFLLKKNPLNSFWVVSCVRPLVPAISGAGALMMTVSRRRR
jgi:hypothetical protein